MERTPNQPDMHTEAQPAIMQPEQVSQWRRVVAGVALFAASASVTFNAAPAYADEHEPTVQETAVSTVFEEPTPEEETSPAVDEPTDEPTPEDPPTTPTEPEEPPVEPEEPVEEPPVVEEEPEETPPVVIQPTRPKTPKMLIVASYNILSSKLTRPGGYYGKRTDRQRARIGANILKGKHGTAKVDIWGAQEMQPDQLRAYSHFMPEYRYQTAGNMVNNTIFWRKNRFIKKNSGYVNYASYGDAYNQESGRAPWVKLYDKVLKKMVFYINYHGVAWNEDPGTDPGGAIKRFRAAEKIHGWMIKKIRKNPNAIMAGGGDTNGAKVMRGKADRYAAIDYKDRAVKTRFKLPYCQFTKIPRLLQDTRDMFRNKFGHCPDKTRNKWSGRWIDFIFTSPRTAKVVAHDNSDGPRTGPKAAASDHAPVLVALTPR